MNSCTCENWTLEELSNALLNRSNNNRVIVVPMFQRGKRWKKEQESTFIDSMRKGYPVGTMLFYKKVVDNKENYILVDGLQRGNTIRKYMTNPTEFFTANEISDDICQHIISAMNAKDHDIAKARQHLLAFIQAKKNFKYAPSEYYKLAVELRELYNVTSEDCVDSLLRILEEFFSEGLSDYERVGKSVIPVIIYNGDETNLPEIFDRINSKGTPLNLYEVYAAAWPVNVKFKVDCAEIVEAVISKYEILKYEGYVIDNYDKSALLESHRLNAFEYLFGLSKYLTKNYPCLAFNVKTDDDIVNPLAFELVNACLNDSDKIKSLYEHINKMDVNVFQQALEKVIAFVVESIKAVTQFKGNKRGTQTLFHSKFQILSMISTTFKEMYTDGNFSVESADWNNKKGTLQYNLLRYYVYDILTNYWYEGGTGKIHAAAKPNRYMQSISDIDWMVAISSYFQSTLRRQEKGKIKPVGKDDYVFLNCIYLKTFTAMDQLSIDRFDVEHIAPKAQMTKLIESAKNNGLPISSIANLCYLPEYANRSKGAKNFYQDNNYLRLINLEEVETKYSFTNKDDLEWMDLEYDSTDAAVALKDFYNEFLTNRFKKLKELFCASLGIKIIDISDTKQNEYKSFSDEQMSEYVTVIGKGDTKDELYCLEDSEPTTKGRYMKAVIKYYISQHPEMTYNQLLQDLLNRTFNAKFWPQIIALPDEIKKTNLCRYLDCAKTTLISNDGIKFAICNQCNPERMKAIIQMACECKLHTEISYAKSGNTYESMEDNNATSIGAPFRFSMIGLKTGDKVVFEPLGIETLVANDNQVEYQGKLYTTTGFCKEFLPVSFRNTSGAYQGPKYFTYGGKALNVLRKEKEQNNTEM